MERRDPTMWAADVSALLVLTASGSTPSELTMKPRISCSGSRHRPYPGLRPVFAAEPLLQLMAARPRSSTTSPAGWYQTQHGWQWWEGIRWTQVSPMPLQTAPYPTHFGPTMSCLSNGEHAVMTFFTCGLWAPVWIVRLASGKPERSV